MLSGAGRGPGRARGPREREGTPGPPRGAGPGRAALQAVCRDPAAEPRPRSRSRSRGGARRGPPSPRTAGTAPEGSGQAAENARSATTPRCLWPSGHLQGTPGKRVPVGTERPADAADWGISRAKGHLEPHSPGGGVVARGGAHPLRDKLRVRFCNWGHR